eukprot:TRINITY_DN2993_c0_g3_i1.p1 TRINITY_DN2993_c0_g3~~TRINITY_DN2993_c0_g3_i1.p1  ORF type:complete len:157 (-),score=15.26 TRINITY_DN2993_c0_g3_i1:75-545(-)
MKKKSSHMIKFAGKNPCLEVAKGDPSTAIPPRFLALIRNDLIFLETNGAGPQDFDIIFLETNGAGPQDFVHDTLRNIGLGFLFQTLSLLFQLGFLGLKRIRILVKEWISLDFATEILETHRRPFVVRIPGRYSFVSIESRLIRNGEGICRIQRHEA